MNIELLEYCLKGLRKRWKEVLRTSIVIFIAFTFVAGTLIFQSNMYKWQIQSAKSRFGSWYVMYEGSVKAENNDLKNHPYLGTAGLAQVNNYVYNSVGKTDIGIGTLSDRFIEIGNIKLNKGRMPAKDNEIAVEWSTLIKLEQGSDIGQDIVIDTYLNGTSDKLTKTYKLVGILNSYTDVWQGGDKLPGIIVTESEGKAINRYGGGIFIYPINDYIKEDYRDIYNGIEQKVSPIYITYNSSVYDYKPWKDNYVYKYMYIVVMVIGILALSYQLIEYRGRRQTAYQRFRRLGMDKSMMRKMYITENALIIIPAGIVGLILALLTGFAIGKGLEIHNGFHFYKITAGIIIKSVCSVIAAIVVEELAGLIANRLRKHKGGKKKVKSRTHESVSVAGKPSRIKPANLVRTISSRLMRRDGIFMAVGLRAFALCICGILVFSALMIRKSYTAYKANNALPDIYGYLDPTDSVYEMYIYYYAYVKGFYNIPEGDDYSQERSELLNNPWKERNRFNISFGELKNKLKDDGGPVYSIKYNDEDLIMLEPLLVNYLNRYCKRGNTNLLDGFTEEFLAELDNIGGIQSISYSAFESERTWFWDNQDYHKMGLDTISPDNGYGRDTPITDYGYRYIYSTEYVNPTKELYNKLEKYIDKKYRNYDDFVNGRQVVVFLQDAPDGTYDDTLKAGDTLNYNYYQLPVDPNIHLESDMTSGNYVYPYDKAFYEKYNNSGKINLYVDYDGHGGSSIGGYDKTNDKQILDGYEVLFDACVSPTVAAVIKVTNDVREDFNGIMVDYGYYTALAGMSLAEQAVDNQRNLMERMTGDEMTGDLDFSLHYNQLSVQYDLSSAFSATNNKLSVYFENNDLAYGSNVDAKNIYRTQLINNILQYGITIAAAVVIQLLIMAIIVRNRIERRKERYKLLHGLGMRRGTIVRICMLEALRESVWCIFTMPLILIMELLMYTRKNLVE